ncbi:GNAT family N-acetyltransferase [Salipiger sp. IMCC34102]|uniref:GNAT family N-acetyltransferase n=1 Tax=Salipiger sp. IMCC34102 TaxID=2510647 RepID=UPI00101D01AB|nr:GNAT family N-acetyltransferase [Salipiger sp. IMCC34102]RYH03227.1 GNAT family N-acetyltransferase [Salipiger sp. IMCC34102]
MTGPNVRLTARPARTGADLDACLRLRHRRFIGGEGQDTDAHDTACDHLMIETRGRLVATARTLLVPDGAALDRTLSAQSYDLSPLAVVGTPILEVGRLCTAAGTLDADVLRCLLAALTRMVDERRIGLMIGCTSFPGADPSRHAAGLGLLGRHHLSPRGLRPTARTAEAVELNGAVLDRRAALASLPPLLRSYLAMGGWVGPQAVIDRKLDTMHVFTCVEVARIPAARTRALRALAG